MDEWIKNLWAKNKIFFFLLLPIIVLWFLRGIIIDFLIKDSRKIGNEAQAKDDKLSQEQTAANAKANQLVEDAKKLSENKPSVGEDWYKNDK